MKLVIVSNFLTDHLGNTRVAYQSAPTAGPYIINAVDYYPYGKILRQYDNGEGDRYLTTQHSLSRYFGKRDQETGLDYRGARYYDSDIARFLSTDPWANKYPAWSTYNYVMGNPVMLIDPTGKGAEYKKEVAEAMAARARKEENGSYTAEVVENPDQPGDYGVNYSKTVNGKKYEGVQYEGTFKGIIGGGLQKFETSGFSNNVDLGNKWSWSSEPHNDNGDILIMSASQISVGVGMPFIQQAIPKFKTNYEKTI